MFKKVLVRSIASATAVGSALAISLVATPAVVTSAPEIRNVDCPYAATVTTNPQVAVRPAVAIYGTAAKATAAVDAVGGRVKFRLFNSNGGVRNEWTVALSGGKAAVTLPRGLPARASYTVNAKYLPKKCSEFKPGTSGRAPYTVKPAGTRTQVNAPNISRRQRPAVNVSVSSGSPLTPRGKVRIVLVRQGNNIAAQTKRLSGGRTSATFRKVRPGKYTMKVRYLATRNFRASSGADTFRVRR